VIFNYKNINFIIFFIILMILSCESTPRQPEESGVPSEIPQTPENPGYFPDTQGQHVTSPAPAANPQQQGTSGQPAGSHGQTGSLADEIRNMTESGILLSMLQAIELIRSRDLSGSDFGRTMSGINTLLIRFVYPDSLTRLPVVDLPQTSNYTRIIRETERGVYTRPGAESNDFLEYILPFLAFNQLNEDLYPVILADLEKARHLRPGSVLPPFFKGLVYEHSNNFHEAYSLYNQAFNISSGFYPAQIGIARVTRHLNNTRDSVEILSDLIITHPDSSEIKRELALSYFLNGDWSRALPAIDDILRTEPRNGEFLLMRAHIFLFQGNYSQANAALDNYAAINTTNRDYLFMRARIQIEGNRNRDSALNYLRSILRTNPNDIEALIYAVTLLMESQRASDQTEGRELLARLQQLSGSSVEVLSLSLREAVRRENWQEAQRYLNNILSVRRTTADLTDGYYIERGLGNNARALTYARELYERDTANNDYAVIYISALIDSGQSAEASRLIESRLNSITNAQLKSRFFYLRSRLRATMDEALSDLRSSLFEDPRNLDAIIATFEIYHNNREERRAVYYLRQALAIAPDHPLLRRYEVEYASLLGRN